LTKGTYRNGTVAHDIRSAKTALRVSSKGGRWNYPWLGRTYVAMPRAYYFGEDWARRIRRSVGEFGKRKREHKGGSSPDWAIWLVPETNTLYPTDRMNAIDDQPTAIKKLEEEVRKEGRLVGFD